MSTAKEPARTAARREQPEESRYARFGLPLPKVTLRALEKRGIYCQSGISIEHQHLAQRYVLRATECGGAVADMGRYCAYLDPEGNPVPWLQPIDSLSGNGRHAIIIAPELVRIEMLRVERTYELAISRHSLSYFEDRTRPRITSTLLFRGRQGILALELWKEENRRLRGSLAPVFYTSAGELRRTPERFDEAIRKTAGALCCVGCKHAHIAVAPSAIAGGCP
ncbi:MAG: hypothetical protein ACYCOR_00335 [Acidobacteriaceae bacterium]